MAISNAFDEIPMDARGVPMLVAASDEDYGTYVEWLADYLYRPSAMPQEPLVEWLAGTALIGIESEIASAIWDDPYADYPPDNRLPDNLARHADILYREAMSLVLSRVPDRAVRIKLIHAFYAELNCDASK